MSVVAGLSFGVMTPTKLRNAAGFELHRITTASGVSITALPGGCLYSIERSGVQLNQVRSSPVAGGIGRMFLRVFEPAGIRPVELIGPNATSAFAAAPDRFSWRGSTDNLQFLVTCQTKGDAWFFHVQIENQQSSPVTCDVVLLQDVGLAATAQVRNSELFTSQYLDHSVQAHPACGYVIMTRQNLQQLGNSHPWLMQGCLEGCVGFSTDGFDFFGASSKATGIPTALAREVIGTSVRQYETAYIAIQSTKLAIPTGHRGERTFFARYQPNHPGASGIADLEAIDQLRSTWQSVERFAPAKAELTARKSIFETAELFKSDDLTQSEIDALFPSERRHVELVDGQLHSFFSGADAHHVVLKRKEIASDRPHGHIMRSGEGFTPADELMSATFYAAGVFGSQLSMGHTSVGKLFSGVRDPLNIIRSSGLRIFVREDATWKLLGIPSAFEMARDEVAWHYRNRSGPITIRCRASDQFPAMTFEIESSTPREVLVCGEVCCGPGEYDHQPSLTIDADNQRLILHPESGSFLSMKEPGLGFGIVSSTKHEIAELSGDAPLFEDRIGRDLPYCTILTRSTRRFVFSIVASRKNDEDLERLCRRFEGSGLPHGSGFWHSVTAQVKLNAPASKHAQAIEDALNWFARDAMIHLSVPRGLEQANGGAWGVRDVCQGPVEFLLSYGHVRVVADIIRTLFAHQYAQRHDWPQWFSFAPFEEIQSTHCHGDVLIWPLKALCDYLEESNDRSILDEQLPYTDDETFKRTTHRESVLQHVDRLLDRVEASFLPGTALPRYGEGDWDDSLQPADPVLRDQMVSAWTTELLYQSLTRWAAILQHFKLQERSQRAQSMASRVKADFQRCLLKDSIVSGFALFDGANPREFLLHPADTRTGLKYRLIPMTRGIISQIFTPEQAKLHLDLVQKHLLFPDGARLMDRPTVYRGGLETVFRRSESASFFGREIGLQYVHAHLRYAESLAALGRGEDLLKALLMVNPIAVEGVVPNANPRQRNTFFSSSDACFATRQEASQRYDDLKRGIIRVNGGWRVYSSGPGIYTNLVIRHLFGIRRYLDWIEFDPVLPGDLNDAELTFMHNGKRLTYRFSTGSNASPQVRINDQPATDASEAPHPYRPGAIRIHRNKLSHDLLSAENVIQIEK
jgi:cellobiose phosphorylase